MWEMASTALGQPLEDPPGDGITALRFSGTSDLLMATSWDGVRALHYKQTWLSRTVAEAAAQTQLNSKYLCY